jgi:molecular chaperone DnaK
VSASGGLSEDQIKQMIRDAELHAEEDKKKKNLQEAINSAENNIFELNKSLETNKELLSEEDTAKLKQGIENLRALLAKPNPDAEEIKEAVQKLQAEALQAYEAGYARVSRFSSSKIKYSIILSSLSDTHHI